MGRDAETKELMRMLHIWREAQERHSGDMSFFYYSQKIIDSLEYKLNETGRQVG